MYTLRARYLFPVSQPPIENGTITIAEGRIVDVGRKSPSGSVEDLGNVALLPGFINAHTHLEFSDLSGPLGFQGIRLVDWIPLLIAHRRTSSDRAGAILQGAAESFRHGVTTIADIAQHDSLEPWAAIAANQTDSCAVFLELLAPTLQRVDAAMEMAAQFLLNPPRRLALAGISPHAPYSVHPELLRRAIDLAADARAPVAMHLAESPEEMQLLATGAGPLRDFLESIDAWDPAAEAGGRRPLDYLQMLARAERSLVVHGNYLDDEEIALAAAHRDRMAVVYCPRTHAWFGHPRYPLEKMLAAGVVVALGTDSRASNPDLSILSEMRYLFRTFAGVPPAKILELGTLAGARALGMGNDRGSLEVNKRAHLCAVRLPNESAADPHELLLGTELPVDRVFRDSTDVLLKRSGALR